MIALRSPTQKIKQKVNKKLNIRFGKEALELADRVIMGSGKKKIDEYVLREALDRQKRLYVGFNKETESNYIDLL